MPVFTLRFYSAITAVFGVTQIVYNAGWLNRPAPPFGTPDWLIVLELAWTLVSIDVGVRLRRRALPIALPLSYTLYTFLTLAYSAWLASTSGTGGISEAMIPLWWKLVAIAVGAWYVAGAIVLFARTIDS